MAAGAKVPVFYYAQGRRKHMTNNRVKNVDCMVGEGVKFERIRRVTGYLSGDLSRFNNAKRAEVADRLEHGLGRRPAKTDRDREER